LSPRFCPSRDLQHFFGRHQAFGWNTRLVTGALRAVGAILAATASFDAKERAKLDFVIRPMLQINGPRLLDQVKKRLSINLLKAFQRARIHAFFTS